VRAVTSDELVAIAAELSAIYRPLPAFAAATGLRPEEWQALQRRDIDRHAGVVSVHRTVSSGEVVELAKTQRSRRQIPLARRAWLLIAGRRQLERKLRAFIDHYNTHRPHRALGLTAPQKDRTPLHLAYTDTDKCARRRDRLGGLIHEYRMAA
jgi:integrase